MSIRSTKAGIRHARGILPCIVLFFACPQMKKFTLVESVPVDVARKRRNSSSNDNDGDDYTLAGSPTKQPRRLSIGSCVRRRKRIDVASHAPSLPDLPYEVWYHIATYLYSSDCTMNDRRAFRQTCLLFRTVIARVQLNAGPLCKLCDRPASYGIDSYNIQAIRVKNTVNKSIPWEFSLQLLERGCLTDLTGLHAFDLWHQQDYRVLSTYWTRMVLHEACIKKFFLPANIPKAGAPSTLAVPSTATTTADEETGITSSGTILIGRNLYALPAIAIPDLVRPERMREYDRVVFARYRTTPRATGLMDQENHHDGGAANLFHGAFGIGNSTVRRIDSVGALGIGFSTDFDKQIEILKLPLRPDLSSTGISQQRIRRFVRYVLQRIVMSALGSREFVATPSLPADYLPLPDELSLTSTASPREPLPFGRCIGCCQNRVGRSIGGRVVYHGIWTKRPVDARMYATDEMHSMCSLGACYNDIQASKIRLSTDDSPEFADLQAQLRSYAKSLFDWSSLNAWGVSRHSDLVFLDAFEKQTGDPLYSLLPPFPHAILGCNEIDLVDLYCSTCTMQQQQQQQQQPTLAESETTNHSPVLSQIDEALENTAGPPAADPSRVTDLLWRIERLRDECSLLRSWDLNFCHNRTIPTMPHARSLFINATIISRILYWIPETEWPYHKIVIYQRSYRSFFDEYPPNWIAM